MKINNFMFNVKQLKMYDFMKYIWQLINGTPNATLEVPSLRPCKLMKSFINDLYDYGYTGEQAENNKEESWDNEEIDIKC